MSFTAYDKAGEKKSNDDYGTSKMAYEFIKDFVPTGKVLYDPFYFNGSCVKYVEEVFAPTEFIHKDKDAFTWFPENVDFVITNPPFSRKYEVLDWLLKKDVPFAVLLPLTTMCAQKFQKIKGADKIQFVVTSRRVKFEIKGQDKLGSANFDSTWFCYKMDLPRDVVYR